MLVDLLSSNSQFGVYLQHLFQQILTLSTNFYLIIAKIQLLFCNFIKLFIFNQILKRSLAK